MLWWMLFRLDDRADVLIDLGRLEAALDELEQAADLDPTDVGLVGERVWLLCRLGRNEEALAESTRAVASGRGTSDELAGVLVNRALALSHLGRLDEALADYDRALSVVPGDAAVLDLRELLREAQNERAPLDGFEFGGFEGEQGEIEEVPGAT